jgi:23S rRNA (uracil1939-C5)-methyltransferase
MNKQSEEIVTLRIEKIVYRGDGLARMNGLAVFVPGTIEGELVEAGIEERKKNFARAALVKILEPSPFRIKPICPLAVEQSETSAYDNGYCPGCSYQHIAYEEEVRIKNNQFTEMIRYKTKVENGVFLTPAASPVPLGYRNKITLHTWRRGGNVTLGYLGPDNRTVIDIPECPLAVKSINELLKDLRGKSGFIVSLMNGENIILRYTDNDGAHYKTTRTLPTRNILSEKTSLGLLEVPFSSFFQVNPFIADNLAAEVSQMIRSMNPRFVADLYCGVGVFGLAASKAGAGRVIGVDNETDAISAAVQNASSLGLKNVEFKAITAEEGLKKLSREFTGDETCIILDPPRAGLEKSVIEKILEYGPRDIIYVSCAADTLARDLQILCSGKYRIVNARLFDMFPRTPYFESVTRLARI